MTVSISSGHSASYLTDAVAAGRENYYTGAVAAGEPPGRWSGRGAAALGLAGEVDAQDMTALYERYLDPRDERFKDPLRWDEAEQAGATLGHTGRKYKTEDEIYADALAKEPGADAERRAALRVEAGKRARKNVAFLDATFSVQKSVTVLHTAFEAQEVRARSAAEQARTALHALTGAPGASGGAPASADSAAGAASAPGGSGAGRGAVQAAPGRLTVGQRREADRLTATIVAAEAEAVSWSTYRLAVEDAIWAGNQAALSYLSDKAGYARVGHHGGSAGRWVDAHDWTIASFFQHDSRDHDPQLHIHNAILNRVQGDDGKWRTIDAKAIYRYRGAAGSVGERVMEQHLTRSLGVRFAMRPDGKAREVVGIDQPVMDLFSSRRRAITRKTTKLVTAFETKFGRSPNSLELDRLQRQATFASRRAKSHEGETVAERLERWDAQLRAEVSGGLRQVADQVMSNDTRQERPAARWKASEVIETALADVQETKSAWTAPDLTRAIGNALPDDLGDLRPDQVTLLLDRLTEEALKLAVPLDARRPGEQHLPDQLRLADGTSAYQSRGARLYATPAHIHTERLLKAAAAERTAPAMPAAAVDQLLAELADMGTAGVALGADQVAAVRGILTSGATVETLVGPAGTGKSFVVGTIARAWEDPTAWHPQSPERRFPRLGGRPTPQRRVVALAASQIATEVLADEGLTARNITQWLAVQQRLADADQAGAEPSARDRAWALRAGDLVVVDESAMANTADLARIHAHCSAVGAKLLLVGDHRQLAAVGAAGAMEMVAEHSIRHELAETRRFHQAWEGPASLRLRDRDESALAEYHKHGRLLDCGAMEQAEASAARGWLADTLRAKHSLLIVDSNEQAARLSARIRTDLVQLGLVGDDQRVALGLQGTFAGDGDIVQARRNAWDLAGYAGNRRGPINREQYRVLEVLDNGDLKVATITGRRDLTGHAAGQGSQGSGLAYDYGEHLTLPATYVEQHLALGYASTVHAAQGLTVDTAHTVATGATSAEALYVAMSRARERNTAHVVTEAIPADAPVGLTKTAIHRSPQAVLAGAFDTADPHLSALAEATRSEAEAGTVRTPAELLADAAQIATAERTSRWLDELVDQGSLTPAQRSELAAEDGASTLATLLRRVELAGHDPRDVLADAVERRTLDDARQITNVIHRRITDTTTLDPVGDSYTDWIPQIDDEQWLAYLESLADAAEERWAGLGEQVAAAQPQWAVEALGPVPAEGTTHRDDWIAAAAPAAAHRELVGHDDEADAIGPAPKPGQAEAYASWRTAWRALGRPEADRAEAEMSDGQLRVRVRAYEREVIWAPAYVANELAGTRQAAARHRQDAAVRRAEADSPETTATGDDSGLDRAERRALRLREAEETEALADALDARAADLAAADEVRAQWYAHTAETRAAADRARAELSAREAAGQLTRDDESALTAEEWLAESEAATRAEDPHREVTAEHEVTDLEAQREHDQQTADRVPADADRDQNPSATRIPNDQRVADTPAADDAAKTTAPADATEHSAPTVPEPELAPVDIRQQAAHDTDDQAGRPSSRDEDAVRVPTAGETAGSVRRAHRALTELRHRERVEEQRANDEARDEELARWHADSTDTHADNAAATQDDRATVPSTSTASIESADSGAAHSAPDSGPVLERGHR